MNKGYSVLGWNHPGFGSSTVSNMRKELNFTYNLNNPREKNCYCSVIKLYFIATIKLYKNVAVVVIDI